MHDKQFVKQGPVSDIQNKTADVLSTCGRGVEKQNHN